MKAYSRRPNYRNIRLARALAITLQKKFQDTPEAWSLWRRMSPHVSIVVHRLGLWAAEDAEAFRLAAAARLGEPPSCYGFADLVCWLCLLPSQREYGQED